MKVRAYKTIDVDFEADIDIDDVMAEMSERIKEGGRAWLCCALDCLTRMLNRVGPEAINGLPPDARRILAERLAGEAKRYAVGEKDA